MWEVRGARQRRRLSSRGDAQAEDHGVRGYSAVKGTGRRFSSHRVGLLRSRRRQIVFLGSG